MRQTAARLPMLTNAEWELSAGTNPFQPESADPARDDRLADLVDELPEPMRDVVTMRIWGRLTFDEIAVELEMPSRGYAHMYWTRALGRLKEAFDG